MNFWRKFDWFKGIVLIYLKNELVKILKESIQALSRFQQ